jgi:hypothetical protein
MFGTFEAEEECRLWTLQPIIMYNPVTLNFHEWKDMSIDVIKSRSKEAYAMLFTSPSKLEAVKTEFKSFQEKEK